MKCQALSSMEQKKYFCSVVTDTLRLKFIKQFPNIHVHVYAMSLHDFFSQDIVMTLKQHC